MNMMLFHERLDLFFKFPGLRWLISFNTHGGLHSFDELLIQIGGYLHTLPPIMKVTRQFEDALARIALAGFVDEIIGA
jgi:hypothetical protein